MRHIRAPNTLLLFASIAVPCGGRPHEGHTQYGYKRTHGGDRVTLDLLLPATWLGIGVALGVPCGIVIAVTVWRYSHGWVSRWMDLREE